MEHSCVWLIVLKPVKTKQKHVPSTITLNSLAESSAISGMHDIFILTAEYFKLFCITWIDKGISRSSRNHNICPSMIHLLSGTNLSRGLILHLTDSSLKDVLLSLSSVPDVAKKTSFCFSDYTTYYCGDHTSSCSSNDVICDQISFIPALAFL